MKMPESREVVRAFFEAADIAKRAHQTLSSAHLLLALFTFENRARTLLLERRVDEDVILAAIRVIEEEPDGIVPELRARAKSLGSGSSSSEIDCLHVLIAVTRARDCFAYRLLQRSGVSLTAIRNVAVSYVTGNMPRRFRAMKPSEAPVRTVGRRSRVEKPGVVELDPSQAVNTDSESENDADEFEEISHAVEAASNDDSATARHVPHVATPTTTSRPAIAAARPRKGATTLAELAPTLAECAVDLTEKARRGDIDAAIGRDGELEKLIDTLGKRRANNPILVGPPGVGKTAIVEGLALKIAKREDDVAHMHGRLVAALDTGAMVAGTSLRGAFSERLGQIKDEVANADGQVVVFVDEIHTLVGAGASGEGAQDAANELKTALARGAFPCIGATTDEEYRKHVEKDPALERRFSPIHVDEPSVDEAILIVEGAITAYSDHHEVDYQLDAIHNAVQLSHRYVNERHLPDKAFAVLDLAGSRARRRGGNSVARMDVARVIHEWTGVPLERLAQADSERFHHAETIMGERLIGHQEVVRTAASAIRRGFAGFGGKRPIASMLFLGPSGVGKTELAKVIAEFLFGRKDAMLRIDMSELAEAHSVARLIGAQPGYVGYEEGGYLTEKLRKRPFQVVVFDEIEKSHPDVLNLLLQILDEGHLTDSKGKRVSFTNTVIILTSNLGADASKTTSIGFGDTSPSSGAHDGVLDSARTRLAPELWGRLDEKLVFAPLSRTEVSQVAHLQLTESSTALFEEREITLKWDEAIIDFLMTQGGYSAHSGARGMRHAIQRHVEGPIAEEVLVGQILPGDVVHLEVDGEQLATRTESRSRAAG